MLLEYTDTECTLWLSRNDGSFVSERSDGWCARFDDGVFIPLTHGERLRRVTRISDCECRADWCGHVSTFRKLQVLAVVPYRDRPAHLDYFLRHTAPLLHSHGIELLVAEQSDSAEFNKAALLNAALQQAKADYYILHDVDCNPTLETVRRLYTPRGLATDTVRCIFTSRHRRAIMPVVMFSHAQLRRCRGLNSCFSGWGCEDTDLGNRVLHYGFKLEYNLIRDKASRCYVGFSVFDDDTEKESGWGDSTTPSWHARLQRRHKAANKEWDDMSVAERTNHLAVAGGIGQVSAHVARRDARYWGEHVHFEIEAANALIISGPPGQQPHRGRYLTAAALAEQLCMLPQRVPAVFVRDTPERWKGVEDLNAVQRGVAGCALAHFDAWQIVLRRQQGLFIFEDDIRLACESSVAQRLIEAAVANAGDADIVFLGYWRQFLCTHAYYLRPSGASKLSESFTPSGTTPVDHLIRALCTQGTLRYSHAADVPNTDETDCDGVVKQARAQVTCHRLHGWETEYSV